MNIIHRGKIGAMVVVAVLLWTWLFAMAFAKPSAIAAVLNENENNVQATSAETPLCRFGANVAHGRLITEFNPSVLRIGWYNDYSTRQSPARPQQIEYAPTINIRQTGAFTYSFSPSLTNIDLFTAANPGAEWIMGNEPDRRYFQDSAEPHIYAMAYEFFYKYIKSKDPTARLIAGSIVQATPIRLQYLDMVLQSYQTQFGVPMPVDIWGLHNFVLNEASCTHYQNDFQVCWGADIPPGITATDGLRITIQDNDSFPLFTEQIVRFRRWMADRGYRQTPLYLSEFGVLMPPGYGFPALRVNRFMNRTFDYLLNETDQAIGNPADNNRLVQRFSWYSFNDKVPSQYNGFLFELTENSTTYKLSEMGQNFLTYTSAISEMVDLYPVNFTLTAVPTSDGSVPLTYTLIAQVANSGNTLAAHTAVLRFVRIAANGQETQIGADQTIRLAGCGQNTTVQVDWSPPTDFVFPLQGDLLAVRVDPNNVVNEVNESNNSRLILSKFHYLPLVAK